MKRIFFLALVVISSIAAYSQKASSVVVVLKNGTEITGKVKEFNPTTKIVLSVGGFDTTINMSDVSSVTNKSNSNTIEQAATATTKDSILSLPKDTIINICGVDVKFILMTGGVFKYGFDGRGSLSMESEPVHDVKLSPFYVTEKFVSRDLYKAVTGNEVHKKFSISYYDKKKDGKELDKYVFFMSTTLDKMRKLPSLEGFMESLDSTYSGMFSLPTEVQWFYCEKQQAEKTVDLINLDLIYCQFAKEVSMSDFYDPIGMSIVVKGSTRHDEDDEIDKYRLYDRSRSKLTNIYWQGFGENFVIYNKFRNKSYYETVRSAILCPIRLVMKVKQ